MKDKTGYTIELEASKARFLEEMATQYGLGDMGKAVRCLIDYARENEDKREDIFNEVRCIDCGS